MKKSNKKGFTLVELVVVIAIIGVLAAILVPSMMGYVKKSRLQSANSDAKTAYNALVEYIADEDTKGNPNPDIDADGNVADWNGETGAKKVIYDALSDNGDAAGFVYAGMADELHNGAKNSPFVQWKKGSSDNIIGQYPDPAGDVEKATSISWGAYTYVNE